MRDDVGYRWRWITGREPRVRVSWRSGMISLGHGDGQWWVHAPSIPRAAVCFSIGVGYDLSFDYAFIEQFDATVHAFDPTPLSTAWIAQQPMVPGLHFHPVGLANYDGLARFVLPTHHGVSFTALPYGNHKASTECQVARLSTLRRLAGQDRIDLIKVDIEGGEYDVIDDLASSGIPQVMVEFHHRLIGSGGVARTTAAIRTLRRAGYHLVHRSQRGLEYVFLLA
jgi:FkbM family methyltransferase